MQQLPKSIIHLVYALKYWEAATYKGLTYALGLSHRDHYHSARDLVRRGLIEGVVQFAGKSRSGKVVVCLSKKGLDMLKELENA